MFSVGLRLAAKVCSKNSLFLPVFSKSFNSSIFGNSSAKLFPETDVDEVDDFLLLFESLKIKICKYG